MDPMIRVELPYQLRHLANIPVQIELATSSPATFRAVIEALEIRYPMLRGTICDPLTGKRRPLLRFYACGQDWSHHPLDEPLPDAVMAGSEPLLIIGAIAGG